MYIGERNAPSTPLYEARKRILAERETEQGWGLMDFIGGLVSTMAIGLVGIVVVMGIAAWFVWLIF